MKIAICIKQVPDTETKIRLNAGKTGIDEAGVKWVVNPYDEFAIEEAIKTKEALGQGQVTVYTLGPKSRAIECLRTALAMGADEAVAIDCTEQVDAFATAKALAAAIQKEGGADLVFTGKLAIDDNGSSVSQMIAEMLNIPHATVISKLERGSGTATVEREIEGGTKETLEMKGAFVLAANKGLNTPRYASLPGIMKAKKKTVKEYSWTDLGVSATDVKVKFKNFEMPAEKPPVKMIEGSPEDQAKTLVNLLMNEAKVF